MQSADQDPVMDELLARTLARTRASGACVEADEVAAWVEGGLAAADAAAVEAHVSSCARCQAVMATLLRAEPPATPASAVRGWWSVRWLLPIAGVAAAVAIYVATDPQDPAGQETPTATMAQTEPTKSVAAPDADTQAQAAPQASSLEKRAAPDSAGETTARTPAPQAAQAAAPNEPPPAATALAELAPAPPPPGVAAAAPAPAAPVQAEAGAAASTARFEARERAAAPADQAQAMLGTGPDRWRIAGGVAEYSSDGGITWRPTSGATTVTAGAWAGGRVCWLVGPGGAVFVTADGVAFTRVRFPVTVALVGIAATDERTATVTTIDGRRFSTSDQGATWTPVP